MRVVVADATPLHYLILTGAIQVLPRIFEKIHVPIEVRDELSCEATPPAARTQLDAAISPLPCFLPSSGTFEI
jgi:predicted nucleic acid-binding protein